MSETATNQDEQIVVHVHEDNNWVTIGLGEDFQQATYSGRWIATDTLDEVRR